MEQIVSENLVKTQKVVVKDADTEEVKYERNLTSSPKLRTMSAVSEDVTLVSGESATYYDEYNNIQDLKNAIIENYPEKDNEEVAKDILRALAQDEDVINSITTNEVDVILDYESAMAGYCFYSVIENTGEVSEESINNITSTEALNSNIQRSNSNYSAGQLTTHQQILKAYTWAAHYGKDSEGKEKFNSYTTIRWEEEDSHKYYDTIALSSNSELINYIPESPLSPSISGYIQRFYECTNYKKNAGDEGVEWIESVVDESVVYEETKFADGTYVSDSKDITTKRNYTNNISTVTFSAPYNMKLPNCGEQHSSDYDLNHEKNSYSTKYYVSQCTRSDGEAKTVFQGIYYHKVKDYEQYDNIEVKADIGFNLDGFVFDIGINASAGFQSTYVEKEFPTPIIIAHYNNGNFSNWTTAIT